MIRQRHRAYRMPQPRRRAAAPWSSPLLRLALALLLWLAAGSVPAGDDIVFGINEGVTYRITPQETRERYRELGELLAKTLHKPVRIEPVDDYVKLRRNLEDLRYDLAFIHPAHHSLRAMRDQKYQLVALTKGFTEYKARFLVKQDSPLRKPEDIRGRKLVMPDPDSITAWMVRATLRDLGIDPRKAAIDTTRYQDAIPFMLENGFDEVGSTAAAAVIRDWQSRGGKVLFESRPVPIKHLIAAPSMSKDDVERVRELMVGLERSKDNRRALERIGFQGFIAGDDRTLAEIGKWLGI
jgi:ABC-type phosphate/phosphonate transport system substrate-binding protein